MDRIGWWTALRNKGTPGTINLLCGCVIGKNRGWLVGNEEVEINIANNMMGDEEEQDDDDD